MSDGFGSFRFGWDAPTRISTSTVVLQEQSLLLPGEPMYAPIPFLPTLTNGDGSPTTDAEGHAIWSSYPSRCDLYFYQGDDVVIPLFFNDPDVAGDDMETGYEWTAQIRVRHSHKSGLLANFSIDAQYHAPGLPMAGEADEYTKVDLFLPRMFNDVWGIYEWEIYSNRTQDMSRFPEPEGWPDDTPWPQADTVKTWLYGRCIILPRTTTTDYLPIDPVVITIGPNGIVYGPNGALSTGGNPSVGINAWGELGVVPQ